MFLLGFNRIAKWYYNSKAFKSSSFAFDFANKIMDRKEIILVLTLQFFASSQRTLRLTFLLLKNP